MERISHYQIVRLLGRGGMGEVHEAIDLDLGRHVALKFVTSALSGDSDAMLRFEREARAAALLQHPGIATVFAFERTPPRPFIVMELLGGRSLRDALAVGPLPLAEALAIARDVAAALAFAHRRGVVHRDIKPENLMFDLEGTVKITDFGLARIADAARLTSTGVMPGTAAYMAPEALQPRDDAAATAEPGATASGAPADVFALGVTLHEMLAGRTPFPGESPLAMMYAIANQPPPALRTVRADVPEEAEELVSRMLEKNPAARITAEEVARELARLTDAPIALSPHPGAAHRAPDPPPAPARPKRPIGAGVVLVAALLAAGVWAGLRVVRERAAAATARAVRLNNEGHDSLASGASVAARERFEAALALDPRYGAAKLNLAALLQREGDMDRAAALYGQAIAENSGDEALLAAAHYGLGEMDLSSGAWPSATTHLEEAARRDTTRVEYPNNLAYALIRAGKPDDALVVLRAARARFPGEAALSKNEALAWFEVGRFEQALAAADEAVRLRPGHATAWSIKARSEAALGRVASARASLQALERLDAEATLVAETETAVRQAETAARR